MKDESKKKGVKTMVCDIQELITAANMNSGDICTKIGINSLLSPTKDSSEDIDGRLKTLKEECTMLVDTLAAISIALD